MKTTTIFKVIIAFSLLFCISCNSANGNSSEESQKTNEKSVESVLERLNARTKELKSYQCQLLFRHYQPSLFETQTIRTGILYYSKFDSESSDGLKNVSKMRVNFQTLKQDEDEEEEYKEEYIIVDGSSVPGTNGKYKGLWLIQLDYDSKHCNYAQLARADEPNKPMDVFELISTRFPIIGFSKTDRLKEEFDISLVSRDKNDGLIQVQFKVKPNSIHKDNYVQIDCLIDEKLNLPVEIIAISTEPEGETTDNKDVFELKFTNAQINEKIDKKIFDFQIPKDFGDPEVYPLD